MSDWIWTNRPNEVGFNNRPVMGAMYAPVLVAQGRALGLGAAANEGDASLARARGIFREAWAARPAPAADAGADAVAGAAGAQ